MIKSRDLFEAHLPVADLDPRTAIGRDHAPWFRRRTYTSAIARGTCSNTSPCCRTSRVPTVVCCPGECGN